MPEKVDLYDSAYGNYELDVYRKVRVATYGEDFGQTGWTTTEESNEIPQLLELQADSSVLEIGCGSGGYAVHVAQKMGCRITGLDINARGISNANQLAAASGLSSKARFELCDVSKRLPFDTNTFDAAFSNDVFCHIPGRASLLSEMIRVLKPGGRMLFSDALIIGGMLTNAEIATRSSIGYYIFSPPGENERLIEASGFTDLRTIDTTENAAQIARRWHDARQKHQEELLAAEGAGNFEGLQRFLTTVQTLTSERRLLRRVYLAQKRATATEAAIA